MTQSAYIIDLPSGISFFIGGSGSKRFKLGMASPFRIHPYPGISYAGVICLGLTTGKGSFPRLLSQLKTQVRFDWTLFETETISSRLGVETNFLGYYNRLSFLVFMRRGPESGLPTRELSHKVADRLKSVRGLLQSRIPTQLFGTATCVLFAFDSDSHIIEQN